VTVAGKGGSLAALPILQAHGDIASFGFPFGNLAYSCDLSGMPPESAAASSRDAPS
jgi:phosphoribosyl 1,2-cyclic phosphate phosphodiesterase